MRQTCDHYILGCKEVKAVQVCRTGHYSYRARYTRQLPQKKQDIPVFLAREQGPKWLLQSCMVSGCTFAGHGASEHTFCSVVRDHCSLFWGQQSCTSPQNACFGVLCQKSVFLGGPPAILRVSHDAHGSADLEDGFLDLECVVLEGMSY